MDLVVTLVAPGTLDPGLVAPLVKHLGAEHAERLSGSATDVFVSGDLAAVRQATKDATCDLGIDALVQPAATRHKRLLLSDMDSTLIGQECIDELAERRGIKSDVAAITAQAMRGEIDFTASLTERVALLKGIPVEEIAHLLETTITLSPGAAQMVKGLKRHGVRTVLVSGGFTHFAEPIGRKLGIDSAHANTLLVADGLLTGELAAPILGVDAKRERLERECEALGISPFEAIALGDGANDLAMIAAAGLGVAYRAKPAVAAAADAEIRHSDLTTILYAMGLSGAAIDDTPASNSED
ncbi:MAG: phosphoserine phosphatase SerB [Pseudomonadota bacterium]